MLVKLSIAYAFISFIDFDYFIDTQAIPHIFFNFRYFEAFL